MHLIKVDSKVHKGKLNSSINSISPHREIIPEQSVVKHVG